MVHPQRTRLFKKPTRLGEFTVLDEIGRGGMGVVYRAKDPSGRLFALKVLSSLAGADQESVARFRCEAEAAGRLSHPGIVPVVAVGEEGGFHYFAMDLVQGPSLQELIDGLRGRETSSLTRPLIEEAGLSDGRPAVSPAPAQLGEGDPYARSCARLAARVAGALCAAHEGMVIHRDIKPSNILLSDGDLPVLVDFGLARDQLAVGLTRSGDAVGTPSYMSPEQARGERDVDGRVDVYGLGATLYELLTLRPPFDGAHAGEIMRRILDDQPQPVRRLNPRVPQPLARIVHRCLEKEPALRYPSMEALQRDLEAFLAGRPVFARGPGIRARAGRWLGRNRRPVRIYAASFAVVLLAVISAGVVTSGRNEQLGTAALEQARQHLEARRPDLMQEAYGRARALLGEARVWQARREHVERVFEEYYRAERFALLREILESIPPAHRSPEIRDKLVRLRGMGSVQVRGVGELASLVIRPVDGSGWQAFPDEGILPEGEYLVRVERPGMATVVQPLVVVRDDSVEFEPPAVPAGDLPDGMVLATSGSGVYALDRTEMTAAAYMAFLRRLEDPQLQSEMLPAGWSGPFPPDGPEYPVRGLSFRQARTLAAHFGRHLPSAGEFRGGAFAGLPSWSYPWGTTFDPARVAADPDRLGNPLPADSLSAGASPLGLLHMLGNVAEILSADPDGSLWLAGGHHLSPPRGPVLTAPELLEHPDLARPYAGVRLARFMLPDEAGTAAADAYRRRTREALRDRRLGQLVQWRLQDRGTLSVEVSVPPSRTPEDEIPEPVPGFLSTDRGGVLRRELLPASGLRGDWDGYLLRLPLWSAPAGSAVHELRLPSGCVVEEASPPPEIDFRRSGAAYLVWEVPAGAPVPRPAWVRFRRDGMLAPSWPAHGAVADEVDRLFRALAGRDRRALGDLLDPEFRFAPYGWTRAQLAAASWPELEPTTFSRWRVVDAVPVGSVVAARVDVDWRPRGRSGDVEEILDWPLMVFLRRSPDGYRVLGAKPTDRADSGSVPAPGRYVHEGFKARVEAPEGTTVFRDRRAPVPLQVTCLPAPGAGLEGVEFGVFGYAAAAAGESPARIRHLLSAGDLSGRPGELETGPRQLFIGSSEDSFGTPGETRDWRFWAPDRSEFSRERWTRVEIGLRHFLLRARASGRTRREADQRFQDAQAWFRAMARAVRIE